MRSLRTDDRVVRLRDGLKAEDVRAGTAKHEEDFGIVSEVVPHLLYCRRGIGITAVRRRMADIDCRNRGYHFGMYARPVVRLEMPAVTVVVGRHA